MAENKEVKVKSFRINDETAQKFKEIAESIKGNQQDTMQVLINAYCMEQEKAGLTDYISDLERIEGYTTAILQMYTASLQANKDVKETVKADFQALLQSKDATIQALQEQSEKDKAIKEDAVAKVKELETTTDSLRKEIHTLQGQLQDKEKLNQALSSTVNDLQKKVNSMQEAEEKYNELLAGLEEQKQAFITVQDEMLQLKNKIKIDNDIHENQIKTLQEQLQIAVDKAVLEVEKKCQAEISEYQQRYKELLEEINKSSKTKSRTTKKDEVLNG